MSNEYVLKLNGEAFIGWEDMSLSRSMERASGSFWLSLSADPASRFLSGRLVPGVKAEIEMMGQAVLSGYIDTVSHDFDSAAARVMVTGRDRVSDLIDCAASVDGPYEYSGMRLEQILSTVLDPYDIPFSVEVSTGAAFKRIALQPGESAFDLIERLCRARALLPLSDGLGGLIITKPGSLKSKGQLVYGENILSGTLNLDHKDRFSLVVVKGQQEGSEDNTADDVSSPEGRATDPFVGRFRPKVIVSESQGNSGTFQDRAKWDVSMARARSIRATIRTTGWTTDGDADLWQINTIVRVKDTARSIDREMLIIGTEFSRAPQQGTITTLELGLPEAFDQPAESNPEDDIVGGM
jgi:prophage tail gpP-like protein